jgi:hypothetical protein
MAGTVRPTRFWVLGDGGTGREAQAAVHQTTIKTMANEAKQLDFWIHVGDMAYNTGRDVEFQTRFFEPYETTLRNKVCWPAMGNHEGSNSSGSTGRGPYYDAYVVPTRGETGGLASGTEAYYSFDFANIHFICLDSHDLSRKPGDPMANWLKADLEKAKADWLIAFWHHPPYTKGSHDSDKETDLTEMRKYIMPIIESGGVDLVLTGHSHIYERSMLMDGAYATPTVSENFILDDGDGDPDGDGAYRKSSGINSHEGTVQGGRGKCRRHARPERVHAGDAQGGCRARGGVGGNRRRHPHCTDGQSRWRNPGPFQRREARESRERTAAISLGPPGIQKAGRDAQRSCYTAG